MTIFEKKGETTCDCRFVEGVECVILLYNDIPKDGNALIETCKACGQIHMAVELRRERGESCQ